MDERTLSERVKRLENFLAGIGVSEEEYSGCDKTIVGVAGKWGYQVDPGAEQSTFRCTALEEIINRIQGSADRIMRRAGMLEDVGIRVFGPLPQGGLGAEKTAHEPDGMIDHTFLVLDYLDAAITRLETAALRLDRV